jgi:hypothetical protein
VFELSQTLRQKWLPADYDAKRRILEIVCLNCKLDGVTLVPEIRKPFDVLTEGLLSEKSRGDKIRLELFIAGVRLMQTLEPLTCQKIISFSARRSHVD